MNPEHFLNCPIDCGHCGDGVCSPCPELAETGETCPEDCCTPEPRERCNGMDDTCDGVVDEGFEVGRLCNTHPGGLCMRGVTACVSPTEVGCVDDGPKLCDDGDACTLDSCDKLTGACLHEPGGVEGLACDDGDACSRRDVCRGGVCTGEDPVSCAPSDQCHDTGECDPQTGTCSDPARPEDHPCDDGDACTRSDGCRSGVCVGSDLLECPPPDQCYAEGMCDPSTGLCVDRVKETGAPCDDGNACTRSDECTSGVCVGGDPKPCPAPDECHLEGSCDPTSGECSNPQAIDGTPCGDGKACQGGVCTRGQ